jgi:hypothetical protein
MAADIYRAKLGADSLHACMQLLAVFRLPMARTFCHRWRRSAFRRQSALATCCAFSRMSPTQHGGLMTPPWCANALVPMLSSVMHAQPSRVW